MFLHLHLHNPRQSGLYVRAAFSSVFGRVARVWVQSLYFGVTLKRIAKQLLYGYVLRSSGWWFILQPGTCARCSVMYLRSWYFPDIYQKKTPRTFTVFFMKQNGILTKNESKQRTVARTAGCDESGVYSAGVYILLCRPQRFGPGYFRGHIHCGREGQYGSICQLQSGQFPPQLTAGDKAGRYFWGGGGW